nr:hypothetical protein [Polymorphobacter sp. PAMC 29334]
MAKAFDCSAEVGSPLGPPMLTLGEAAATITAEQLIFSLIRPAGIPLILTDVEPLMTGNLPAWFEH